MITYLKDENQSARKEHMKKLHPHLRINWRSCFFCATSISVTFPVTGVGLVAVQLSAEAACVLSLSIKVSDKITLIQRNKYN